MQESATGAALEIRLELDGLLLVGKSVMPGDYPWHITGRSGRRAGIVALKARVHVDRGEADIDLSGAGDAAENVDVEHDFGV